VWNASGSAYNLGWMLVFALIFTPAIIAYTSWIFHLMGGKVNPEKVAQDDHLY
jgi:cytochrome d ubiquinol oxidase subunit II